MATPPRTKICAERLNKYASDNAIYIDPIIIGNDNNHKNKSGEATKRGNQSYAATQCSAHLRTIYPQQILQDNQETEFCVNSRNDQCPNNKCTLCHIEGDEKCESIKFSEFIGNGGVGDMLLYLGTNYPTNKKYSLLRVKRNGHIIIEYGIKLIPNSSMIKTASPSGQKYNDRMSVSRLSKIQSNHHKDVILCITDAIHGVGFCNLLKDGGIRYLLQLKKEEAVNAGFYCLLQTDSQEIHTVDVELVINREGMKNKVISLWHYAENEDEENVESEEENSDHDEKSKDGDYEEDQFVIEDDNINDNNNNNHIDNTVYNNNYGNNNNQNEYNIAQQQANHFNYDAGLQQQIQSSIQQIHLQQQQILHLQQQQQHLMRQMNMIHAQQQQIHGHHISAYCYAPNSYPNSIPSQQNHQYVNGNLNGYGASRAPRYDVTSSRHDPYHHHHQQQIVNTEQNDVPSLSSSVIPMNPFYFNESPFYNMLQ